MYIWSINSIWIWVFTKIWKHISPISLGGIVGCAGPSLCVVSLTSSFYLDDFSYSSPITVLFPAYHLVSPFPSSSCDFTGNTIWWFMPWLCVDHMKQQGVWPMGFSYPDPLVKSRPTDKIQTHWQNPDPLVGTQSSSHFNT